MTPQRVPVLADWPCYHAAIRAVNAELAKEGAGPLTVAEVQAAGMRVPVRPLDGVPWWEWHANRGEVEAALRHLKGPVRDLERGGDRDGDDATQLQGLRPENP